MQEQHSADFDETCQELQQRVDELKKQVEDCQEDLNKTQTEVDRLLDIMKESENEKHEKDKAIKDLQELVHEGI